MVKLFASRGHKATIITTPYYVHLLSKTIQKTSVYGSLINVLTLEFPCAENGLPQGCQSLDMASTPDLLSKFFKATTTLGTKLDQLLQQYRLDCLVADMLFPWATDVAARYGIPRLIFHGTCFFALCATVCVYRYAPHKDVTSDCDPFLIPNLPEETQFVKLFREINETNERSYGVLVNSLYELERVYADHYRKGLGFKSWHIGPLFLYNKMDEEDRANRGMEPSIDEHECMNWLNSKKPNSVIYVCFGSLADFDDAQLLEIAHGLEASGQEFIWVVKKGKHEGVKAEWLPVGFEKRMEGKGLIIRGWATQMLILQHEAMGGFVTHCGWNSTLEGICAGLPMVTWPVLADQFYNEKLITQILGIGVSIDNRRWSMFMVDCMKREAIENAVSRIMVGEEAEEMRSRARALGEMAKGAVEEGGSSCSDLNALIEELKQRKMVPDSS
ncbi:UDP-glucose flavonoid 3-O-glucosyltransferase 7 [Ziziphus jujuba]|uniref:Glycosyltransferase n=1 Tax=Ziziphus jujuba TaxID=326968 RepID=A0ABM3I7L5_ZIZJJ|nr:UDP-glucose flavonoid 3-O-glucosyltransferase 7 [Ziziphus jujuba]